MELHQLQYLVMIADVGTVSKAAEILLISQPALTRSIQKLEDELGYPLFDRVKNRLILNDNGELAVKHAKKILKEKDKMIEALTLYQKNKHMISIGSSAPAPLWALKYIFNKNYPEMKIETMMNENNETLIEGLYNHQYSIIILDYPINSKDIISIKLFDETLHIAVKPDDLLANHQSITFKELDGTNILCLSQIGYWMELQKEKLPHSLLLVQDDVDIYNALKEASTLPVFRTNISLHRYKNKENRIYIPITDKEATLSFYAIYHKNNHFIYNIINQHIDKIPWEEFKPI